MNNIVRNSLVLIVTALAFASCNCKTDDQDEESKAQLSSDEGSIEVYYFHYTRRCATCQAVEEESQKALKELYPDQVESGAVTFLSVNLEKEENDALAEKLGVSAQSLLVVKDAKKVDLTSKAFLYARSSPEKLKTEIKEAIISL